MNSKKSRRFIKSLVVCVMLLCYAIGMCTSGIAAGILVRTSIPSYYHGSYDCETVSNHWLKITSGTTSVFRGYYEGSGTVACSNLNTDDGIEFDPEGQYYGDNFVFAYDTWARQIGDAFVPQNGGMQISGHFFSRQDSERRVRISSRYYS